MSNKFLANLRMNIKSYVYVLQGVDGSLAYKALLRAGFKCENCGKEYVESNLTKERNLQIDHRVPLSMRWGEWVR